jgi:hypothetical protein
MGSPLYGADMTRLGLAGLALVLAGCGGGNGAERLTPEAVAEQIGCTGFASSETEEMFVSEQGKCDLDGDEVIINMFSNNDARDNWVEAALQFGGSFAVGDRFVAYSDGNPATTDRVADEVDGDVRR